MKRIRKAHLLTIGASTTALFLGGQSSVPDSAPGPVGSALPRAQAQSAPAGGGGLEGAAVPGELLVRFEAGVDADTRSLVRRRAGGDFKEALPVRGLQLLELDPGSSVSAAEARFERQDGVQYAEPNLYRRASRPASDTYFGRLWALENLGQPVDGTSGSADADIDATEAWDITTGSQDVTIAVIDSGVDGAHPDLAPNMWVNPGESGAGREANGSDDDGNGLVDDARGWDWVDADNDPADLNGHGTHVAGTIAARGGDSRGVTGVSWAGRIMALRVLDASGSGTLADLISAYGYAVRSGARVVNLSLGAPGASRAEADAIRSAPGVLFVAAAGNSATNVDVAPEYPCAYALDNVVCVAASDQRDELAGFSSYGARSVDLAAPGTNILSAYPGGRYAYLDGTSMAAPHVSGAAALLYARDADMPVGVVKSALLDGAERRGALATKTLSGGRLNVRQALDRAAAAPAPGTAAPQGDALAPETPAAPAAPAAPSVPAAPAVPSPASAARPAADTTAPRASVRVPRTIALSTLLTRGVSARVTCSEVCSIRSATLALDPRTARRLGLRAGAGMLVRGSVRRASAGAISFTTRLSASERRRIARARALPVELSTVVGYAGGNRRKVDKRIVIRR